MAITPASSPTCSSTTSWPAGSPNTPANRCRAFLDRTFATIDPHAHELPGLLRVLYPRIRDERWLQSYREVDGIRFALANMSRRFSRQPKLETAARHLIDSRTELERRFDELMPDAIAFARHLRSTDALAVGFPS
jgi:acyl carrier protein phosphodiesterase